MSKQKSLRSANPSQSNWSQGLLTLSSIILGAAVAVGAQRVFEISTSKTGLDAHTIWQALAAFLFTAGTFYHTFTVVSFFFILPNILWVMLPLAVGITVIMSAYAIGNADHAHIAAIVFYFSGICIFSYALVELALERVGLLADAEVDQNAAYKAFRFEMAKNAICFSLMFSISLGIWILIKSTSAPKDIEIFMLINGVIYGVMVLFTELKFLKSVNKLWLDR